ncbi:MAG: decarboxylating 6-phosphogluconate dehydrogenase [Ignavibacteria bacterium]|jgi:6-phosphogluconate dehydrogenase|nr:decarboxylating 6-phosphogluconate dehydrogenase [Ignavibacteria bacterium]MCU7498553.1 decarboxylating 6-phosphogluconate dehydrogenase [Ignavibacteria bacterium]MCU7511647.1 decarboxylating 6-phosphogluconate dehydrogenase [Ignavibacteria bacterium]MCU7519139.1 decarboxylating 6-phosphogluconate dehydrogenase [Ignavibacteria bacterium]MCU7523769.1 decarboxylating 6-phosphogluconate dehydrogenase [Ignavibacteria bacterium]
MDDKKMMFGIIGLGKMGGNLALQAMEKGYKVAGMDKSELSQELRESAIQKAKDVKGLIEDLKRPRVVFLYVPAGKVVDIVIDELSQVMTKGDIIVDGGNSYWGDSITRAGRLKEKGLYFIDCGTSGGISGARHGACFMVGGETEPVNIIAPILKDLAVPEGFVHAGPSGSGHFVKLVHNGIEFGMLEAIGEGMDMLERFREKLNINEVLHAWNHGSVIRSWLVELMEESYKDLRGMETVPPYVEDTGEVNWLVEDALHMEISIPVISQSVMQLFTSRDNQKNWARAIAMMRHGFGGHPYGENEGIKNERRFGRIGGYLMEDEKIRPAEKRR